MVCMSQEYFHFFFSWKILEEESLMAILQTTESGCNGLQWMLAGSKHRSPLFQWVSGIGIVFSVAYGVNS